MLSILIPIYNYKVVKLVDNLLQQCAKCKIPHEIICLDDQSDASFKKHNQEINARLGVNYVELSEKLGRSKIRNRLAMLARYEWLLLLDADTKLPGRRFVKNYLQYLDDDYVAVVGGIKYNKKAPKAKSKLLHWTVGTKREMRSLRHRNKYPHRYFLTANLLIRRKTLLDFPFDQEVEGYGYEDILLGSKLKQNGCKILHVDNPVIHRGLKKSDKLLADQKNASENLAAMYYHGKVTDTKLIKIYEWIRHLGLQDLVFDYIGSKINKYEESLISGENSLFKLDLVKLYYFDRFINGLYNEES